MDPETNDKFASFFIRRPYNGRYLWLNLLVFGSTHLLALAGLYFVFQAKVLTLLVWYLYFQACCFGVTVGAHRLCAHRTFKANFPLKVLMASLFTMAWQQKIVTWCRWHRCHHKWTDTDADPHNINRGFWFAHIGWLLIRPHPEFLRKKDTIDMTDIENDLVFKFQAKYYYILALTSGIILPHMVPLLLWKEEPMVSIPIGFMSWILLMHVTWTINSVAHMWGIKPYNWKITPAENKIATFLAIGEGYHNYHHTFPVDYRTSELGVWFNPSTRFIDFFAWLGWATDLKSTKLETVEKRKMENEWEMKRVGTP